MNCYSHAFELEEYSDLRDSITGAKVSGILAYLEEDIQGSLIIYIKQSEVVHPSRNLKAGIVSTRWGNSDIKEISLEDDKNHYNANPRFFKHKSPDFYVKYFRGNLNIDEIMYELQGARDASI